MPTLSECGEHSGGEGPARGQELHSGQHRLSPLAHKIAKSGGISLPDGC